MSIPGTQAILDRYRSSQISAPIARMELFLVTADADAVARAVASFGGHVAPMHELRRLAAAHAAGGAKIAAMLRPGLDSPAPAGSIDEGVRSSQCTSRVLPPGGDLVRFSYAYGREREADARELGKAAGLSAVRSDESPFRLGNGIAFPLCKPAGRQ